jgi:tetratricopeptide (TPR) repeat protein
MKKIVLFALSVGVTLAASAQKDELKEALKAFKKGDASQTLSIIEPLSTSIRSTEDRYQADYFSLLGDASLKLAQSGDIERYSVAIEAYESVIALENASGKPKYSDAAMGSMNQIANDFVNMAIEDQKAADYSGAAKKLFQSYRLSPRDTIFLYYAAGSAVNGADFDQALEYYIQLRDINYDGSEKRFGAINIETSEMEYFDKPTRDLYIKGGTHKDAKDETTPSKRSEVVKNIALIYQQQGRNEEALKAYDEAQAQNPSDIALMLNKANLYYTLGQPDKFKELMNQASEIDPNNPDLQYNIGVISSEQGNIQEARVAYRKTLEIDPTYINAILNLSSTYVNEGNALVDQMNTLAVSIKKADLDKYDALKEQKDELFRESAAVLEKSLENLPKNNDILTQLKNIYGALGDNDNFKRILGLMEQS